jgi:glyoxylase-like metal-dependent hydrolase (beta-lactamase superfamily II)
LCDEKAGVMMLIDRVVADYFETNCWIIAAEPGQECVIVDPGIGNPDLVSQISLKVTKYKLKPVAVLITHGHLDHFFSVLPLTKSTPMRTFISKEDRFLLENPFGALKSGGESEQLLRAFGITKFKEPSEIIELQDFSVFELAGLNFESIFAPGHTKGSVVFTVNNEQLISGDVLFAGSIGRTDLPTGSAVDMKRTLKERILTLSDELNVLPGHGEQTTIGIERVRNPYLQGDFLDQIGR